MFIKRVEDIKFEIKIDKPIHFSEENSVENITDELNSILEKMVIRNPKQWIWTHNRWK